MGLKEKQAQHNYETNIIPEIKKTLQETLGKDVEIHINWESFSDVNSMQEIEYQVLGRIVEAIRNICRDDFAKGVMVESFNAIHVNNVPDSGAKNVAFANGTLNIQANWVDFGNIFTPGDIRDAIESGL